MKDHKNRDITLPTIEEVNLANHHANASHTSPEVAAMNKPGKNNPVQHGIKAEDKRANTRRIHTNGSTPSDRL